MTDAAVNAPGSVAIIGGSGCYHLVDGGAVDAEAVQTPFATEPVTVYRETTAAGNVWFLPRHGKQHSIAPHLINYRANIWALHHLGISKIVAVNAVGGINRKLTAGALVLPDQIIDYTWGREHTFVGSEHSLDKHVDFTWPYDAEMAAILEVAGSARGLDIISGSVYAAVHGPRLETAAEVSKLQRDGCDIVGMTGMPEAALARELGLRYACIALVVNPAAGIGAETISIPEMKLALTAGMEQIKRLLLDALPALLER